MVKSIRQLKYFLNILERQNDGIVSLWSKPGKKSIVQDKISSRKEIFDFANDIANESMHKLKYKQAWLENYCAAYESKYQQKHNKNVKDTEMFQCELMFAKDYSYTLKAANAETQSQFNINMKAVDNIVVDDDVYIYNYFQSINILKKINNEIKLINHYMNLIKSEYNSLDLEKGIFVNSNESNFFSKIILNTLKEIKDFTYNNYDELCKDNILFVYYLELWESKENAEFFYELLSIEGRGAGKLDVFENIAYKEFVYSYHQHIDNLILLSDMTDYQKQLASELYSNRYEMVLTFVDKLYKKECSFDELMAIMQEVLHPRKELESQDNEEEIDDWDEIEETKNTETQQFNGLTCGVDENGNIYIKSEKNLTN